MLEMRRDAVSPKQMAAVLGVTTNAVYFHLAGLRRKLNLLDDAELFLWAVQHPEDIARGFTRDLMVHRRGCSCAGTSCRIEAPRAA